MITNKIGITRSLRLLIKNKRNERKITGAELSNIINQKASYISALENGRIKNLSSENLIILIKFLFDCDDTNAKSILENNLQKSDHINPMLENNLDLNLKNDLKKSHSDNIKTYKPIEDHTEDITVDDLMDNIKEGFKIFYKKDPDFTMSTLKRFTASFHFDIGFMMVILRTPYFALKGLDHDKRQGFLNDLSDIFNKYAVQSKEKLDEQDKNIKSESTKNNTANNDDTSHESDSGSNTDLQHDDNV